MNKQTVYKDIESINTEIDIVVSKLEDDKDSVVEIHKKVDDLNWVTEDCDLGRGFVDFEDFKLNVLTEYANRKGLYELWFQIKKLLGDIYKYKKTLKNGTNKDKIEEMYFTLTEAYNDLQFTTDDDIYDVDDLIKLLNDIKEKLTDLIE